MIRTCLIAALSVAVLALAPPALAQKGKGKFGSAAEARSMLERAVAALKANEAKALESFNKPDGGFHDRDLYPFCFSMSDGKIVAHVRPAQLGLDVRTTKDATGKLFGLQLFAGAKENEISEVGYMFPRPGSPKPQPKISFVTRVGNIGCGVGYYK